uniref:Uncharacterized protein n=1 Tax=Romanomermis culicivorax TaxID=13658 RepID=A0A915KK71_ROMCU
MLLDRMVYVTKQIKSLAKNGIILSNAIRSKDKVALAFEDSALNCCATAAGGGSGGGSAVKKEK